MSILHRSHPHLRPGRLATAVRRLFTTDSCVGVARAGAERPPSPMLTSISLGGAAFLR